MPRPARLLALMLAASACGPQVGASLAPLSARTAVVGIELEVLVHARGAAAGASFDYSSDLPDLKTRPLKPTIVLLDPGDAVFRWTPLATDLGDHTLTFTIASGGVTSRLDMAVSVVPGLDPLTFREPVGDGTTLDRTRDMCAQVQILVDSTATTKVKLTPGQPWADNATLLAQGPLSGSLKFCPTDAQAQMATIYPFAIDAADGSGNMIEKRYTIVLAQLATPPPPPPNCPTTPPTITTSPHADVTASGPLNIHDTVDDAAGVYDSVIFYSLTQPASPPDLTQLTRVDMVAVSGSSTSMDYAGQIPNPVAGMPSGTSATVYYLIRATDNADQTPGCSYNTSFSPSSDVYSFVVTAP